MYKCIFPSVFEQFYEKYLRIYHEIKGKEVDPKIKQNIETKINTVLV